MHIKYTYRFQYSSQQEKEWDLTATRTKHIHSLTQVFHLVTIWKKIIKIRSHINTHLIVKLIEFCLSWPLAANNPEFLSLICWKSSKVHIRKCLYNANNYYLYSNHIYHQSWKGNYIKGEVEDGEGDEKVSVVVTAGLERYKRGLNGRRSKASSEAFYNYI